MVAGKGHLPFAGPASPELFRGAEAKPHDLSP